MKFQKVGKRFSFIIGSLNISYCLKGVRDKYITLGVNCFPRTKLTKFGIKAKKSDGELSYPFDLCAIPLESVSKILQDNFKDYYDDLVFDNDLNIWVNKKYSIKYYHDKDIEKNKFIERYSERINNFRAKTSFLENLIFVSAIFDETYDKELYLEIYSALKNYCSNDFKYLVVNIKSKVDCQNIISDGNIYYKEILAPCPNYSNIWTDTSLDKKIDKMSGFYNDYVNFVRMF